MSKSKKKKVNEVSELQKELTKMKLENEQMSKILKEREEQLKKLNEVKAMESIIEGENEDEIEEKEEKEEYIDIKDDKLKKSIIEDIERDENFEKVLNNFFKNSEGSIEIYRIKDGKEYKISNIL